MTGDTNGTLYVELAGPPCPVLATTPAATPELLLPVTPAMGMTPAPAAVAVVWARTDEGVRGFLVPKGAPGFTTQDIHKKMSLRASITSELLLDDVRLPDSARLPESNSLRGPLSCLNEARYGIVWGAIGVARACFEAN